MIPVFLVVFLVLSAPVFGTGLLSGDANNPGDTVQYPLDDPRNPNCPCHEQQKLAEKEFALQQSFVHSQVKHEVLDTGSSVGQETLKEVGEKKADNAGPRPAIRKKKAIRDFYKRNRPRFGLADRSPWKNDVERCFLF